MRGGAWALAAFAAIVWVAAVALPSISLALDALGVVHGINADGSSIESATHPSWQLLLTSLGWALAVAIGSTLLGWLPGVVLGRALDGKRFSSLATLMLMPICMPSYMVFYAWWQSWPSDTAIFDWLARRNLMVQARQATLLLGLLCWSWPLVAWCVAGTSASRPARRDDLLRLHGAGPLRRLADRWRTDRPGLLVGGLLVFLATLNNTTCFDLSEVFTYSNELRAITALNASTAQIVASGWPGMALTAFLAATVWMLIGRRAPDEAGRTSAGGGKTALFGSLAIWAASVLLPISLFTMSVLGREGNARIIGEFFTLYRWSVINTIAFAATSGLVAAMTCVGFALAWQDRRAWVRATAATMGITWLAFAALPGTVIGAGVRSGFSMVGDWIGRAYNDADVGRMIMDQPAIVAAAQMSCLGFIAALTGRWLARGETKEIEGRRLLDGARTLTGFLAVSRPRVIAACAATFAAVFVLAMGETPVTAVINPPMRAGHGPLAMTILNDMHYQRPQTVMIAALGMFAGSLLAAAAVAAGWRVLGRSAQRAAALVIVTTSAICLSGCTPDDPDAVEPLDAKVAFGSAGQAMGQFNYPRAIDVDPVRKAVYVVDKSARVQRFDFDGNPQAQWHMPEMANGKPTGVSVAPDGRVFVADTHYFRVIAYDSDGKELMRFGSYGREDGQFIYVTDIAFGPQGRLYVSEYGGHDRVQVFDGEGKYLFQFGSWGAGPGQFARPQSMAFNADKTELFITDACNHRIEVFSPEGKFIRMFGAAGRDAGQFAYPYGLTMLDDGTLLVAEFGNNRIQHVDQQGKCLGLMGGVGRGRGQVQYPWATAATHDDVFVLDSGNNRVQKIRRP